MFKVWKTFTSYIDVKGVLIAFLKPLLLITFNCSNKNAEIFLHTRNNAQNRSTRAIKTVSIQSNWLHVKKIN